MVAITFVELMKLEGETEITVEQKKELGEVNVLWVGTHNEYELTFGNNKAKIKKWLRSHGHIP